MFAEFATGLYIFNFPSGLEDYFQFIGSFSDGNVKRITKEKYWKIDAKREQLQKNVSNIIEPGWKKAKT